VPDSSCSSVLTFFLLYLFLATFMQIHLTEPEGDVSSPDRGRRRSTRRARFLYERNQGARRVQSGSQNSHTLLNIICVMLAT